MWIRMLVLHRPLMAAAFVPNPRIPVCRTIASGCSLLHHPVQRQPVMPPTHAAARPVSLRLFSSRDNNDFADDDHEEGAYKFNPGEKILVEVVSFGPLGASVHVVAVGSHSPQDLPPEDAEWPVLGVGLITQQELAYFRDARKNLEVVLGEILPAYVERVRASDGRLAIALRAFGGRAKARDVGQQIVELLESKGGVYELGDKSSPADIAAVFPGVSKSSFKKALSALYKRGIIDKPQAHEIRLLPKK